MKSKYLLVALLPALVVGCRVKDERPGQDEQVTSGEAQEALEEASISSEVTNAMGGTIEIATSFTIGQAVEQAASEVRAFVEQQMPCAEVTLEGATLTVEYGKKAGNCTYRGLTYSGSHSITVERNEDSDVLVHHAWDGLSNGRVSVSGTADVTWSRADQSRHIVHELTWTRLSDGRTGVGSGDRTQRALGGDLATGIQIDGSRTWEGQSGRWDLAIDGVEMRWTDPVPQAGTYHLATPKNHSLSLSFERVDEDTIEVTVSSGDREFHFNVSKLGSISSS